MVHLEARRLGLKGVEAELIPKFASVIKRAWHLFIALIALVSLLLLDFTPFLAAFWGIILSIVCSYIPPLARRVGLGDLEGETLTPRRWVKAFEEGAKSALAIGAVCACVGLILGTLTLSGLGFKFSGAVVDRGTRAGQAGRAAGGHAFFCLLLRCSGRCHAAGCNGCLCGRRDCRLGAGTRGADRISIVDGQGPGAVHVCLHAESVVHRLQAT